MEKQKEKQKLEYETQVFCGKQLAKTGEGWKLFKTFWGDPERPWTRKMFTRDTPPNNGLALKDLEEGEEYTYGYTVYKGVHPTYGEYESKTIQFVTNAEDNNTKNAEDNNTKKAEDKPTTTAKEEEQEENDFATKSWSCPNELSVFVEEVVANKEQFLNVFGKTLTEEFVTFVTQPETPHAAKEYYDKMVARNATDNEIEWFFLGLFEHLITELQ